MAVPDFQSLLLPVLDLVGQRSPLEVSAVFVPVAAQLELTQEDLGERLASGRQSRFQNRIYWAVVHLRKAGLIRSARRGLLEITDRGLEFLRDNQGRRITIRALEVFPEYVEFRRSDDQGEDAGESSPMAPTATITPEESLEEAVAQLHATLAEDLLEVLLGKSPSFFEKVVVDLLEAMGYGGAEERGTVLGGPGDGGVDGVIKQDRLGLDSIYVQAKRWSRERSVGRPEVPAFAGSLLQHHARKGVLITTSSITNEARAYVAAIDPKIVLLDGAELTRLMIRFDVGVAASQTFTVKKIDTDYFE